MTADLRVHLKKTYWLAALLLFNGLIDSAFLIASEPVWIFNNGPDVRSVMIGQGDLQMESNLLKIIPTGSDLTFSVQMKSNKPFSADRYRYFAIRYKMKTSIKIGGLFFTTDTLPGLSDKSFSPFPIQGDNVWHNSVIDMTSFKHGNWKGKITSFRLDPTNPSTENSEIMISRFGFFSSPNEANAFLKEANDKPNYARTSVFTADFQKSFIPGGTLFDGYKKSQFLLQNHKTEETNLVRKTEPERIIVRVEDQNGSVKTVPVGRTNRSGYTVFTASKPGRYFLAVDRNSSMLTDWDRVEPFDQKIGHKITDQNEVKNKTEIQKAIRFVVSRDLMTAAGNRFRPQDKLSKEEAETIRQKLNESEMKTEEFDQLAKLELTRAETAVILTRLIDRQLKIYPETSLPASWFTRDRIRIGAWGNFRPVDLDENYIKTYRDCGFDWLIAMSDISGGDKRSDLLRWCNKYGIEVFINDGGFRDPENRTAEYCDQPSYAGHYVIDEPGSNSFDKLAAICNSYKKATGGKTPYVNLLPMYANAAQLKYGAQAAAIEYYDPDPDLFKKYCDQFCEKFDTDYICTDIYPLNWTNDHKKNTYRDYVESINIIAASAREHHRAFWCFIQTFAWIKSKRTPNEAEFRWQCYSMLSFGCKGILCWTYAGYRPEFPSLVDHEGQKTQAWHDARPVFHEIGKISDVFVQYRNLGAMTHRASEKVPYLKMSNPYTEFKTIQKIDCSDPLLIGCFEKISGSGSAFTLVNMSELQDEKTIDVLLKIDGKKVVSWQGGIEKTLKPENGQYRFKLKTGEGCFVTVE